MKLTVKKFQELTTTELYEILKARAEIFIMEQEINYRATCCRTNSNVG